MSNPAQPSFVWQLYSYDLEPNASLFAVKKACEPVHIQMNQSDFHLMVINNTPEKLRGMTAHVIVYDLDGEMRGNQTIGVTAAPTTAADIGSVDWPGDLSGTCFVKVELRDRDEKLVSDNFYWRAKPDQQDDFTDLQKMQPVSLHSQIVRHDLNGKCLLDVTLSNWQGGVALLAHLQLRQATSGHRVLPVYYSDNYVSLVPGEWRRISIEAAESDLHGEEPLVVLDGWNVATDDQSFGNVEMATNRSALVDSEPRGIWNVMPGAGIAPASRPVTSQ